MRQATSLGAPPRYAPGVTRIGRFFFRYRDYLAPLGLILILALTRPRPLFASERLDVWLDAAGILIAAIGQTIRVVVIGYAYIQRGGANKQLAADQLVCEGVYAHSRNPMYLGNFLLLTGLAIIYHSPIVYLLALPVYILAILAIIKSEEEFLRGKFGDEYEDYCRRVNRFLPRLQGLRSTFEAMHFDWRRVIRKEYGTIFAWMSVALALIAWEQLHWYGVAAARAALTTLGSVWCGVFGCYVVARWMKKTQRLVSSD
jgi:protein-S-isoprenylcysteine O-methyltransferase Ste14